MSSELVTSNPEKLNQAPRWLVPSLDDDIRGIPVWSDSGIYNSPIDLVEHGSPWLIQTMHTGYPIVDRQLFEKIQASRKPKLVGISEPLEPRKLVSENNPVEGHLTFGDFEQLKGITTWLAEMGIEHLFFDVDATLTAVYDHGNIPHGVHATIQRLRTAGFGLHIATNNEVNLDPLASFLGIDNVVQPDYEIYKISEKYWENLIRVTGIKKLFNDR